MEKVNNELNNNIKKKVNISKKEQVNPSIKKQMKINNPQGKADFKKILKNKKVIVIGIVGLIILIAIIILIVTLLSKTKYEPYYRYEQKMIDYGYSKLYNNEVASTTDKVTRIEVVKMAVIAALNVTDISEYMYEEENIYPDDRWGEYAQRIGILGDFDINYENYDDEIDYITALTYFKNAKNILLPEKESKDTDKKILDIKDYAINEQNAIKDLLAYDIIKEFNGSINGDDIVFKGQINELVVNFVWNLNTITLSQDDKLNINPNNVPSNVDDYPYTLAKFNKDIYEIPFKITQEQSSYTPVELFKHKNNSMKQAVLFAEEFFNCYLNIDYKTIDANNFKNSIEAYKIFSEEQVNIDKYVKYVKDNEIVIEGSSKAVMPVFYFDGNSYKIRLNVKFKVLNSKTKTNLLYYDEMSSLNKIYKDSTYDFYIDYNMSDAIGSNYMYVSPSEMYNNILNPDKVNIEIVNK